MLLFCVFIIVYLFSGSQFFVTLAEARHLGWFSKHVYYYYNNYYNCCLVVVFFVFDIVLIIKNYSKIDGKHVVFGRVVRGFRVFENIAKVPRSSNDKPRRACVVVACGPVKVLTEAVSTLSLSTWSSLTLVDVNCVGVGSWTTARGAGSGWGTRSTRTRRGDSSFVLSRICTSSDVVVVVVVICVLIVLCSWLKMRNELVTLLPALYATLSNVALL